MLTAVLKAVKMLLSCYPKNSQDAAVLAALKQSKMLRKTTPTNTKYKDLFLSLGAERVVPLTDQRPQRTNRSAEETRLSTLMSIPTAWSATSAE
jgi:hypothetical protein